MKGGGRGEVGKGEIEGGGDIVRGAVCGVWRGGGVCTGFGLVGDLRGLVFYIR